MSESDKAAFFDRIATQWDGWEDLATLVPRLREGLLTLGVGADETVLDIGCGTGNLTAALLDRLSAAGRVEAVDISPGMIAIARQKLSDPRVRWHLASARRLPLGDATCDRAICYSAWPHFDSQDEVARELKRVLSPGGRVHIWHLTSRERVNQIHADADAAVQQDHLPPVRELGAWLEQQGFALLSAQETQDSYLLTAGKPV